jgi:hypothetical protein
MTEKLDFDAMFNDMLAHLYEIVVSIVPDVASSELKIGGDQNKKEMRITFANMKNEHVGLFLGRGKRNLDMVFAWLRAQQVCPGDRYLHLTVQTPDGRVQKFYDGNLYKKDKPRETPEATETEKNVE